MKKRYMMMLLVILLAVISIVAIRLLINPTREKNGNIDNRRPISTNAKPMIGVSVDSMVIERWHRDVDIMKTRAEELGFSVEVVNAYEDSNKQAEQIRALIKEGAEAILIVPHEKDKLKMVVEEAKKAGVIILSYDRLIDEANVDAYLSFDNQRVGELMAEAMVDEVPSGNYVVIAGAPQDSNAYMVYDGIYSVLQPRIDDGDITIVGEIWAQNWREDFAYNAIDRLMRDEVRVDAVICANDLLAEGAISALAEYGKAGEIPVTGQDANISACQRIVEGKQLMTVYKPLKNLAEGSIDILVGLIEGRDVTGDNYIDDGANQVPYIKFDVIPVNADNMKETVVKDFFHNEEDIYRNSDQ